MSKPPSAPPDASVAPEQATRGLWWFGAGGLGAAVVLVALLVSVDPYRVWGTPDVRGFNAAKPLAKKQMRMGKRYQVARLRPRAVVMGTSRALSGLALDHPLLVKRAPFALALQAATPQESAAMFAMAARDSDLELAVLGVEFSRWIGSDETRPGFDPVRMARRPALKGWPLPTVDDALAAGLSWDALTASIETVMRSRHGAPPLETLGSPARWERDRPQQPERRVRSLDMFHFKQRETARHAVRHRGAALANWSKNRGYFVQMLDTAAAAGVRLEIFISPCHARYFETLAVAGLWPQYEAWVAEIAELVARHDARARLWDFGGYTPWTTETGPTRSRPASRMRWHWESSHYTPEMGDLVLDAVLADDPEAPGRAAGQGLGRLMRPEDVPAWRRQVAATRAKWQRDAPEEAADVRAIVSEFDPSVAAGTALPATSARPGAPPQP